MVYFRRAALFALICLVVALDAAHPHGGHWTGSGQHASALRRRARHGDQRVSEDWPTVLHKRNGKCVPRKNRAKPATSAQPEESTRPRRPTPPLPKQSSDWPDVPDKESTVSSETISQDLAYSTGSASTGSHSKSPTVLTASITATSSSTFMVPATTPGIPPPEPKPDNPPSSTFSPCEISVYTYDAPAQCNHVYNTVGACGLSTYFPQALSVGLPRIAVPFALFDQYGASQHNTLCGKTVTLKASNGVVRKAVIADRNQGTSFDLCMDIWQDFGYTNGGGRFQAEYYFD